MSHLWEQWHIIVAQNIWSNIRTKYVTIYSKIIYDLKRKNVKIKEQDEHWKGALNDIFTLINFHKFFISVNQPSI